MLACQAKGVIMNKDVNVTTEKLKKLLVRKVGLNYQLTEIGMKFFVEFVAERVNMELQKNEDKRKV